MDCSEKLFERQMLAYLHDPPCKCIDISAHEDLTKSLKLNVFGETMTSPSKVPDWEASAGDRLCLPKGIYGADNLMFSHPFSGNKIEIAIIGAVEKDTQEAQLQALAKDGNLRENLFLLWRFWKSNLAKKHKSCYLWPADTRLPNHSIWHHNNITAAFSRCESLNEDNVRIHEAALFSMQFGPVQEWIEAARSTKDCWAGSHILSRIVAAALKAVSDTYGPTAIITPDICGQPLYDLAEFEILDKFSRWKDTESGVNPELLEIASIPHKFLALIPYSAGPKIAETAVKAAKAKWQEIANESWKIYEFPKEERAEWNSQIESWLQIAWQLTPVPKEVKGKDIQKYITEYAKTNGEGYKALQAEYDFALAIPDDKADTRNYQSIFDGYTIDGKPTYILQYVSGKKIVTATTGTWEAILQKHEAELAARKMIRQAWENSAIIKDDRDHLDGKHPIIAKEIQEALKFKDGILKKNDLLYGAPNLVKRAYPLVFKKELEEKKIKLVTFRNTEELTQKSKYIAVIALDGDEMGKWACGENNPTWGECLTPDIQSKLKTLSMDPSYQNALKTLLITRRSLRPSQMLQFSEALKNFSTLCAPVTVAKYKGTLVYAGGDDVLAFLPAESALDCVQEIQREFSKDFLIKNGIQILPGNTMHISAGICIAHMKEPLQTSISIARQALDWAKKIKQGKGAIGVQLNKHSGETLKWRCQTGEKPQELFAAISASSPPNGFTKKLCQVLQPYQIHAEQDMFKDTALVSIIEDETKHVIKRADMPKNLKIDLEKTLCAYIKMLASRNKDIPATLADYLGPLLTYDFISRRTM